MTVIGAPSWLSSMQEGVQANEKASQALREATRGFAMENTGEVAQRVNELIQQFLRNVLPTVSTWTKVYTFGSGGLGAAIAGSDFDLYTLCSANIEESLFFKKLPHFLENRLSDLVVITAARVPLIKFSHEGVHVDLLFASVDLAEPPTNAQLLQDEFLLKVSQSSRATVNGIRTVLKIQSQLQHGKPHDYACVLRAVKHWAKQRQVYGNLYTFPNGVCLAIMVAKACQLAHTSDPSAVLRFFFHLYVRWLSGGSGGRILAVSLYADDEEGGGGRDLRVTVPGMPPAWDAARDATDLFPILNPALPSVNAAYTVGRSGLQLFYKELLRAHRVLEAHAQSNTGTSFYKELWSPYNILADYHYFIGVHIASTEETQRLCDSVLNAWKGYMESKLRLLVYALEGVAEVRPFPRAVAYGPDREPKLDGSTASYTAARAFFFAVKRQGESLCREMFADAIREFSYFVDEGSTGPHGFERNTHVMHGPWFSFFSTTDADENASVPMASFVGACAEIQKAGVF